MSRKHGFRVYVVEAFHDQVKNHEPVDVSSDSEARDHILEVLESLEDTHFIVPAVPARPGEPEKPTVSITVGEPIVVREDVIHVQLSMGEIGAHRQATRPGAAAQPLEEWSAEAPHWVTFVFPQVDDHPMLVVSSTFRRRDAFPRLLALMTRRSLEMKKAAKQAEDEERARIKAEGQRPPRRAKLWRLVFTKRQGSDGTYLDEIINGAKRATARFERKVASDRGRSAEVVQRVLTIQLHDEADRDGAKRVSRIWSNRFRRGELTSMTDGVSELADELASHDLLEPGEEAAYNGASIFVTSDSGDSTTIAVDALKDAFTYPVSDGRPSVLYYYEKVAPRLRIIAAEEEIEINQLDPMEVEQCLVATTSVPSLPASPEDSGSGELMERSRPTLELGGSSS